MMQANSGNGYSRWLACWFCLLALLLGFFVLLLIDAATSKAERRHGVVERKYFSSEFTVPSVAIEMNANGKIFTVPTQQTYPASYEIEVNDGCRFPVPPDTFRRIREGDRILYRESRGLVYRACEWDSE